MEKEPIARRDDYVIVMRESVGFPCRTREIRDPLDPDKVYLRLDLCPDAEAVYRAFWRANSSMP